MKKRSDSFLSCLSRPLRILCTLLLIVIILLISTGLTAFVQTPETLSSAVSQTGFPTPSPYLDPTHTPVPTITPTPALYAPFGVQYGHGDAALITEQFPTATPASSPTPAATALSLTTDTPAPSYVLLKKGSSGPSVKRLQQALIDLGYLSGNADGQFGNATHSAVLNFQAANSLSADGLAGAQTQSLLFSDQALHADDMPEMDYLILINRDNRVDRHYMPTDLVSISSLIPANVLKVKYDGTMANKTAVLALYEMLTDALADGIDNWQVSSAYRSYNEQQKLVDNSVSKYLKNNPSWGRERALSATYNTVAPAGTSEHQSGLAFDITVPGVSFTGTDQQKWLHAHCTDYGFIVRFTEDKQSLTGFIAESWHFRYVGREAAKQMKQQNWCLEEYIDQMGL